MTNQKKQLLILALFVLASLGVGAMLLAVMTTGDIGRVYAAAGSYVIYLTPDGPTVLVGGQELFTADAQYDPDGNGVQTFTLEADQAIVFSATDPGSTLDPGFTSDNPGTSTYTAPGSPTTDTVVATLARFVDSTPAILAQAATSVYVIAPEVEPEPEVIEPEPEAIEPEPEVIEPEPEVIEPEPEVIEPEPEVIEPEPEVIEPEPEVIEPEPEVIEPEPEVIEPEPEVIEPEPEPEPECISIQDPDVTITLDPTSVRKGRTVQATVTITDDGTIESVSDLTAQTTVLLRNDQLNLTGLGTDTVSGTASFTVNLAVGTYQVRLTATDNCGNPTTGTASLTVRAALTPTPTPTPVLTTIATATYGSALAPEADNFRSFRDGYLMSTAVGSEVIRAYYTTSPSVANWIGQHEMARLGTKVVLLPLAMFIRMPWTIAVVIGMFIASLGMVRSARRKA